MTHLSTLQCSMYADRELPETEIEWIDGHIESCPDCRASVKRFVEEKTLITQALKTEDTVVVPTAVPKFKKPLSLKGFAMANLVTGLVIWVMQILWKTLFRELVVNALIQATSIYIPGVYIDVA